MELCRTYRDGLQLEVELARLARLDQLTGLANRRCFDEILAGEWQRAQRHGWELALVVFDVDEFKPYNDQFGHPAGDSCLRRLANAAREVVHRHGDLVARLGGEEFAVVLPQTPVGGAAAVAGREVVTISIGVASLRPNAEQRIEDLIEAADQALYAAKRAGRNRVVAAPADGGADVLPTRVQVPA
jgi:two-component system chemotaxis family response regulator WspR